MKKLNYYILCLLWMFFSLPILAQSSSLPEDLDTDASLGDVFSDFNEDIDSSKVTEDERYYKYGRFYSFNIGLGFTTFTGNRGIAYKNDLPSYTMSLVYFMDFQRAIVLGLAYSKHHFNIDTLVNAHNTEVLGNVSVSMLRTFFGFRYYIDTADLGTAITFANPYLTTRLEYWYQVNKFTDRNDTLAPEKGGGLGLGVGLGLEFPIEIKESYIGVEMLYHMVNFFDKDTQNYRQIPGDPNSTNGYDNLNGNAWSTMVTYNLSW
ncbi:MAG: hypothetical protein KBD63_00155 [Bacteriovoracaceae bacterium]|nr:hypothetical protein [Bacteriovoracaceae bacterium]